MPSEHAPSVGARKFGRNFSLLSKSSKDQPADSRWNFSKSTGPVTELTDARQDGKKQQKSAAQLDKRQSKMNVFDMFSKPKVERARGFHEAGAESPPERSRTPAHLYRLPDVDEGDKSPVKQQIGVQRDVPKRQARLSDNWEAPPLFQAYPQAVKLSSLHTINASTETLIRLQQLTSSGVNSTLAVVGEEREGQRQASRTAPKRFSTAAESLDLIEKIFILVTEGRIVQYAGRGNSSRMPEKVLQLGPKSAAFACDLIPGRHWVIQVVQAANEDGAPAIKQSRSLLSKLRTPLVRKTTTSFLMVLDSAEEMDSWLKVIRSMIERLGGKRVHSDPQPGENEGVEDDGRRPDKIPSHRFIAQKPPSQGQYRGEYTTPLKSTASTTLSSPVGAPASQGVAPKNFSRLSSPRDSNRMSHFEREVNLPRNHLQRSPSTPDTSSVATTNVSTDQLRLDQLREGSRYSFISTRTSRTSVTETVATSRCSSSPPSPRKEIFTEPSSQHDPLPPLPTAPNRSPDSNIKRAIARLSV